MEHNNIKMIESGLKCDNPNCDWEDRNIIYADYKSWINKPCPKCGENVLTEEDYLRAETVRAVYKFVNSISPEQLSELASQISPEDILRLKQDPMFADAEGIENLTNNKFVNMSVNTHKEIKVVAIKPLENEGQ